MWNENDTQTIILLRNKHLVSFGKKILCYFQPFLFGGVGECGKMWNFSNRWQCYPSLSFQVAWAHHDRPSQYKSLYVALKLLPKKPPLPQNFVETRWTYMSEHLGCMVVKIWDYLPETGKLHDIQTSKEWPTYQCLARCNKYGCTSNDPGKTSVCGGKDGEANG